MWPPLSVEGRRPQTPWNKKIRQTSSNEIIVDNQQNENGAIASWDGFQSLQPSRWAQDRLTPASKAHQNKSLFDKALKGHFPGFQDQGFTHLRSTSSSVFWSNSGSQDYNNLIVTFVLRYYIYKSPEVTGTRPYLCQFPRTRFGWFLPSPANVNNHHEM